MAGDERKPKLEGRQVIERNLIVTWGMFGTKDGWRLCSDRGEGMSEIVAI